MIIVRKKTGGGGAAWLEVGPEGSMIVHVQYCIYTVVLWTVPRGVLTNFFLPTDVFLQQQ